MSFKVLFECGGAKRNVLKVKYDLHQEVDPTGRPSSITRGGRMWITVESTGETDLTAWAYDSFQRKDGVVKFIKRDNDASLKELKFTEAYMVKYKENFSSTGETPLTETFMLSARQISMGSGEHVNEWV